MNNLFDSSRLVSLDFKQFCPLYGTTIKIPKNVLLYTKNNILIKSRPTFFTSRPNINTGYSIYISDRPLCLIDIRYMKDLMLQIFTNNTYESYNIDMVIFICTLSLGLCSYKKQLELYSRNIDYDSDRLKNMESHSESISNGIRIGEAAIDYKMALIAKRLFGKICDGVIAPALYSTYRSENSYIEPEEILLFNPKKCGIYTAKADILDNYPIEKIDMDKFLLKWNIEHYIRPDLYIFSNISHHIVYIDKNDIMYRLSKDNYKSLKRWVKIATKHLFKPENNYMNYLRPHPICKISQWIIKND